MKIVQVNTRDVRGGAARAAYRLHQALQRIGQDSQMVVRWKTITDASVVEVTHQTLELEYTAPEWQALQHRYINKNLSQQARTIFSLPYPGFDLTPVEAIAQADIIHLHWVALFVSPTALRKLLDLGKPVVWTLHDMWPFTGGCHYASGCHGYEQSCSACPQLQDDPYNLPQAVLQDRIEQLAGYNNLTIVTPSRWLGSVVRQSQVLGDRRIEVIPNPIETDLYQPLNKTEVRERLGIPPNAFTVVAQSSNESRKEFPQLLRAIQQALRDPRLRAAADAGHVRFLFFGHQNQPLEAIDPCFVYAGWSNHDSKLAEIYAAGDLFLLPSLEDNLPNVMLEAMSCGTPILAFDVGGMPDVIQAGKTGWLAPVGEFETLARMLVDIVLDPEPCYRMRPLCRQVAETHYSMEAIAQRFMALYQDLLQPTAESDWNAPRFTEKAIAESMAMGTEAIATMATLAPPIMAPLERTEAVSVATFEPSLGSHVAAVYEPVLMRSLLHVSQDHIALERQLQRMREALEERDNLIEAMKTSKFWKLRSRWFQIKRRLGLPDNE